MDNTSNSHGYYDRERARTADHHKKSRNKSNYMYIEDFSDIESSNLNRRRQNDDRKFYQYYDNVHGRTRQNIPSFSTTYSGMKIWPNRSDDEFGENDGMSVFSSDNLLHIPGKRQEVITKRPVEEKRFRHVGVQMTTKYVLDPPPKKEVNDASTQTRPITPPPVVVRTPSPKTHTSGPPTPIIDIVEEENSPIVLPGIRKNQTTPILFYVGGLNKKGSGKKGSKQKPQPLRIIQVDTKYIHDRYMRTNSVTEQDRKSKKPLHVTFKNTHKERTKKIPDFSF